MGDLSGIPQKLNEAIHLLEETSKDFTGLQLQIAINYGGRDEIVRATKKFAEAYKNGEAKLEDLDEGSFKNYLWQPDMPDVDLMIRTSGEQRLSNYMLYQNAYAEFGEQYFPIAEEITEVKWPDFRRKAFIDCLKEYQNRNRRYGGLKNE